MSDETESDTETLAPPQDPPTGDELAAAGVDQPDGGTQSSDDTEVPDEPESEDDYEVTEPTPVGHQVIQDNVTTPGEEHTHTVDPDSGEHVETVRKTVLDPEPEDDEEPADPED